MIKLEDCPIDIQNQILGNNFTRYNFIHNIENKKYLHLLLDEKDFSLRCDLVEKIDISHLPKLINDKETIIRYCVAMRIHNSYLYFFKDDLSPLVRDMVEKRLKKEIIIKNKCEICVKNSY